MVTITVTLTDDRLQKLQELANQVCIATEELVRVHNLISRKRLGMVSKRTKNSISHWHKIVRRNSSGYFEISHDYSPSHFKRDESHLA